MAKGVWLIVPAKRVNCLQKMNSSTAISKLASIFPCDVTNGDPFWIHFLESIRVWVVLMLSKNIMIEGNSDDLITIPF